MKWRVTGEFLDPSHHHTNVRLKVDGWGSGDDAKGWPAAGDPRWRHLATAINPAKPTARPTEPNSLKG